MKKAITLTGSTLAMMCVCIFANAQEDTTHVNIITPNEHNNELWINDDTKADTTQVDDFTIEEQNITLSVGESLQLHVNPSSANVRWVQGAWDLSANPILVVDQNGLITALKAGESYVPGTSQATTPSAFLRPFTTLAKARKSSMRPLVQAPRNT